MMKICKWIAALSTVVLVIALCFMTVLANDDDGGQTGDSGRTVLVDGNNVFANGVPIRIQPGDDGQPYVYDAAGQTRLVETAITGKTIYGGGRNTDVEGDVRITVDNVATGRIYGGGYSDGTASADVKGDVSIRIQGKVAVSSLYGGGYATATKGDARANVTGHVTVEIPATPAGNHGNLYGGGYAYTSNAYNATADVGAVAFSCTGRTYSVRGGGSATAASGATGMAAAHVVGAVQLTLDSVDVREVYSAGYATGATARATVGSVSTTVDNSEVMILVGGGSASAGNADVAGQVAIRLTDCFNLYGYVYGGGDASNGGSANVGGVDLQVTGSATPVEEQFGQWVAGCFYGGGTADGAGSRAKVLGAVALTFEGNELAGNVYGGGEAHKGGQAPVGAVTITFRDNAGVLVEEIQETGYSSVYAAGDTDGDASSVAGAQSSTVIVEGTTLENVWGGMIADGAPASIEGASRLVLGSGQTPLRTVACFDTVKLKSMLSIEDGFLQKAEGRATELVVEGLGMGDVVVSCGDTDAALGWFTLRGGKLAYTVEEDRAVWKIAPRDFTITASAGKGGTITPSGEVAVQEGQTPVFTVTAAAGYRIDRVLVDGQAVVLTDGRYTFAPLTASHTIEAQYRLQDIEIPPAVVEKGESPDAPDVALGDGQTLADTLLNEEDREAIAAGSDVGIVLRVDTVTDPPKAVEEAVRQQIANSNQTFAMHLDIHLLKVTDGVESPIPQVAAPLRLTIAIPEAYRAAGRTYSVIRMHTAADGTLETSLLPDLDDDPETITIETDRFSIYSLVYAQAAGTTVTTGTVATDSTAGTGTTAVPTASATATTPEGSGAQTGDSLPLWPLCFLAAGGLTALVCIRGRKARQ